MRQDIVQAFHWQSVRPSLTLPTTTIVPFIQPYKSLLGQRAVLHSSVRHVVLFWSRFASVMSTSFHLA